MSVNIQTNRHIYNGYRQVPEDTSYGLSAPTSSTLGSPGQKFYVTSNGASNGIVTAIYHYDGQTNTWIKMPGSPAALTPKLSPVLSIITTPPTSPNDQQRHIIKATATGVWATREGQIAEWDAANSSWIYFTPNNLDQTTVTTGTDAGVWQYDRTSKTWVQIQQGVELTPIPANPEAGRLRLTSDNLNFPVSTGTQWLFIQNESVVVYGGASASNAGDGSASNNLPRKLSVNYMGGTDNNYVPGASYFPKFVDAIYHIPSLILALDSNGKLWTMGSQGMGRVGHTTTASGTTPVSRVPQYGLAPIQYWQTGPGANLKVAKLYAHPSKSNSEGNVTSYVITTTGDVYCAGANNWGQLGDGTTTASNAWKKINGLSDVVKISVNWAGAVFLTKTGDLFRLGSVPSFGTSTTPTLMLSGVSDMCFMHQSGDSLYATKTDGTLWVGGNNSNGQLALGNTTTQTSFVQVPGVNDAWKVFAPMGTSYKYFCLLRKDGSISFAGQNGAGIYGYGTAGTSYNILVTPTGNWQGTVVDVLCGNSNCYVITTDGKMYGAGPKNLMPVGGSPSDANIWLQVPLSGTALGARLATSGTNDGVVVLQENHKLVGWGLSSTLWNTTQAQAYAPTYIPLTDLTDDSLPLATMPEFLLDKVGSLGTITSIASVSDIMDGGSGQTVTFVINYTGATTGVATITGTATGANISSSTIQTTSATISSTSGTLSVSFTINAADIAALVPPNTQAQPWSLTINGTTLTTNGLRLTGINVSQYLTTSLTRYNSASNGDVVAISLAEWNAIVAGMSPTKVGFADSVFTTGGGNFGTNLVVRPTAFGASQGANFSGTRIPFAYRIGTTSNGALLTGVSTGLGFATTTTGGATNLGSTTGAGQTGVFTENGGIAHYVIKNASTIPPANSFTTFYLAGATMNQGASVAGNVTQYNNATATSVVSPPTTGNIGGTPPRVQALEI